MRDDALLWKNVRTCVPYVPDLEALRAASTRVVVAAGEESARQLAGRGRPAWRRPWGWRRCSPATTPASRVASTARGQAGGVRRRLREVLDAEPRAHPPRRVTRDWRTTARRAR